MELLLKIWNLTVNTNLLNFIVFAAILIVVFKKINVSAILTSVQEKVRQAIEDANAFKSDSESKLHSAQKEVEKLPQDIKEINERAIKNAESVATKILEDASKQVSNIEKNAQKVIEAEEKQIISDLMKNISEASIERAKENIKNLLEQNGDLHKKYINDSIDKLDGLKF